MGKRAERDMLRSAGFVPGGGDERSGLALLQTDGAGPIKVKLATVGSVDAALAWLRSGLEGADLDGLGVGAPLAWATTQGGLRPMDLWIRQHHSGAGQAIRAPLLRSGAALVQGVAMAMRSRRVWPRAWLNETHPEALWRWLGHGLPLDDWLQDAIGASPAPKLANQGQRLALVSAWATFMGLSGRWTRDLAAGDENLLLPAGQAHLFWPDPE